MKVAMAMISLLRLCREEAEEVGMLEGGKVGRSTQASPPSIFSFLLSHLLLSHLFFAIELIL